MEPRKLTSEMMPRSTFEPPSVPRETISGRRASEMVDPVEARTSLAILMSCPPTESRPSPALTTWAGRTLSVPTNEATYAERREVVDLEWRPDLLDLALAHDHDPVRQRERLLLIVGHVDRRDPELSLDRPDLGRAARRGSWRRGRTGARRGGGPAARSPAPGRAQHAAADRPRAGTETACRLSPQVDQLEELADALLDLVRSGACEPSARSRCCSTRSCSGIARRTGRPCRCCACSAACR